MLNRRIHVCYFKWASGFSIVYTISPSSSRFRRNLKPFECEIFLDIVLVSHCPRCLLSSLVIVTQFDFFATSRNLLAWLWALWWRHKLELPVDVASSNMLL